jgi:hypothetical protein
MTVPAVVPVSMYRGMLVGPVAKMCRHCGKVLSSTATARLCDDEECEAEEEEYRFNRWAERQP